MSSPQPLMCNCRVPAAIRTVMKDSPNKGQQFWTCKSSKCKFFVWHQGPPVNQDSFTISPRVSENGGGADTASLPSSRKVTPKPALVVQVVSEMQLKVLPDGTLQDVVAISYPSGCIVSGLITKTLQSEGLHGIMENGKYIFPKEDYDKIFQRIEALPRSDTCKIQFVHLPRHVIDLLNRAKVFDESKQVLEAGRVPDSLFSQLKPFQRKGLEFAVNRNGRVFLGDEMGLGKTIQAIAIASYYYRDWPLLVVCMSSLKHTWKSEFQKWLPALNPEKIHLVQNRNPIPENVSVVIISFTMVHNCETQLMMRPFQTIIIDESHCLKDSRTKRTIAVTKISKPAKHIMLLSGTPALARPIELFSQLNLILPDIVPFKAFADRYCAPMNTGFGGRSNYNGHSHLAELQWLLHRTVLIRRLKKDVLKELPAKIRQEIQIEITDKERKMMHKQINALKETGEGGGGKPLSKNGLELFFMSSRAKAPAVCEYVSDLMESGEKFLIFAHFTEMLNSIELVVKRECEKDNRDWSYIRIDGHTPELGRHNMVETFRQNDNCRVAVLSVTAAGTGLTFTPCSVVVFAELHWTPSVLAQAEDRVHRIGQQDCCTAIYLLAEGTIDEVLWPKLQEKFQVCSEVLDLESRSLAMDSKSEFTRNSDFVNVVSFEDTEVPQPEVSIDPNQTTLDSWFQKRPREVEDDNDDVVVEEFRPSLPKEDSLVFLSSPPRGPTTDLNAPPITETEVTPRKDLLSLSRMDGRTPLQTVVPRNINPCAVPGATSSQPKRTVLFKVSDGVQALNRFAFPGN
eukprot:PhF_6_TR2243/c0_g1_i4/m.3822/K14440/SMARCAL1, HARP; SWI/SNF-related matrix-associated actin-dependent regulator of chromatin subfamily A-like protein 1